jgi:O-acetyl-ADP-ribose deacetylase (regulator of RNase III)
MISEVKGNLLSLTRGILVFGCNCQGILAGGFGKFVHEKWPDVRAAYAAAHDSPGLYLGDIVAVASTTWGPASLLDRHVACFSSALPDELIVVNAMTEFECGKDPDTVYVDYDALEAAFLRIRLLARDTGLPVHFPLIGCGLAHGKWEEVAVRIERALGADVDKTLWTLPG